MKKLFFFISVFFLYTNLISQDYKPGDHELLFMPTAYTMPKGNTYFTDYELVLLNLTHALTDRTHIGVFTLFPVSIEFMESVSLGVKQNYFKNDILQAAAYLSITPKSKFYTLGNTLSIGIPGNSLHLNVNYMNTFSQDKSEGEDTFDNKSNDESVFVFGVGYRYDPTENTSLIVEYFNGSEFLFLDNFGGMLSFGFRFRSEYLSWEIGGFRPLNEDVDDILLMPVLKATYYFH